MSLPASITTRQVHINLRDKDGAAATGQVDFTNRYALRDTEGHLILAPGTYTADLVEGEATIELPVTDDAETSPTGWAYTVRVATDVLEDRFSIEVPTGDLSTLEFSDIAPVPSAAQVASYALASLGGKNGLNTVRICGRKGTTGAPATGTWDTGDLVIDSAGAWHLCTAGGTPGTWT